MSDFLDVTTLIRKALEERLQSLQPAMDTAFENTKYEPKPDCPYQRAFLLPAPSQSIGFTGRARDFVRETGIFQISLYYPINEGTREAGSRAEAIRNHFRRGTTLISGGIKVITERGSVATALREGTWHVLPVSIPYYSNILIS